MQYFTYLSDFCIKTLFPEDIIWGLGEIMNQFKLNLFGTLIKIYIKLVCAKIYDF